MEGEKKKKGVHLHHYHVSFTLILIIILVIALLVMIKPAILGYKLSKQFEDINLSPSEILSTIAGLQSDLLITKTNLDSCEKARDTFSINLNEEKNRSFSCLQEKQGLDNKAANERRDFQLNFSKIEANLDLKDRDLKKSTSDFEDLGLNSANNICCKARVDDNTIDSFTVLNNKVICTSGEERKLSCNGT